MDQNNDMDGPLVTRAAFLLIASLALGLPSATAAADRPVRTVAVVDPLGPGPFRTIQSALDSLAEESAETRIIRIRPGVYAEKIYITKRHVALVGEDRERTRIVYPELRRIWRQTHPDDWGAAVINIGDTVSDVVIANLTVHNNYGSLHGDHDHQFAIRSGGAATRLSLISVNAIADGGDTVSLWNTATGLYYFADSYFEGHVDFVCPRGWCYTTDSRFFGHNTSASIWHDGNLFPDSKFVIRNSRFDGIPGFALGRNTRDGQFFLVDSFFSKNMADKPIYQAPGTATFRWPLRAYFAGSEREGGLLPWLADNLHTAPGAPRREQIDAAWTFDGRWDPEEALPSGILPAPAIPRPGDRASVVAGAIRLRWLASRDATRYEVRFGDTKTPPVIARVTLAEAPAVALTPGRLYYWRVDAVTRQGTRVRGPLWSFTTLP